MKRVKNCPCPTCSGKPDYQCVRDGQTDTKHAKPQTLKERTLADVHKEAKALIKMAAHENGGNIPVQYYDLLLAIWRYEDVMNLPETTLDQQKEGA